jgi:hypothetical protein
MMARRFPPREGLVEEIGGIRITRRRPPAWILVAMVAIVAWGLFYLITYSVTDAGSFQPPEGIVRAVFLRAAP